MALEDPKKAYRQARQKALDRMDELERWLLKPPPPNCHMQHVGDVVEVEYLLRQAIKHIDRASEGYQK